ncbi:hypothetical protein A3D84_02125 [Candidatus Woesebacteria bacterium RIFCSPHIGHO2_02_FULL_42_20]|uniref:Uncharacterized protein n=1 Tax=Candidatus Woesebacteria bacterium RIFCSPHIGHO2_12_FULL_41_24 TaxID=1802510 RepID=A0A1F8AU99_9BACT|nr:MAG: hypothetical protein A2W15_04405 [Candidatus Woesebacteria bacterium RBG_16_41_13]OGM30044.1 MAG: hypothetical protein A2873_04960 [Candidatus Woesebacteria bacterium RIFCSPHIGHO2_01_FULL_42_80]OGM35122.1 MAG: hypothetical protein A3D84_02125 [Candidatus Woesebacteria bacterium RIFCSPHIGHO2_02_FULL_42_20]OGM54858.1 MAG: hypothetical protein A3E44_01725 [Candidatus Woesebacteria bacterium RIFCSPHIGHO2_12_FULL_41_24]OGM67474.1 MAG: hypothetical protein A2969_05575 [Candidatus Woesebacteri
MHRCTQVRSPTTRIIFYSGDVTRMESGRTVQDIALRKGVMAVLQKGRGLGVLINIVKQALGLL